MDLSNLPCQARFKSTSQIIGWHFDDAIVTVVRELGDNERDLDEAGRMFECVTASGEHLEAFEDELTDPKAVTK